MYVPASFRETNQNKLFDFIEQHSFGMLVSQLDDLPFVTHVPFLLERESASNGRLISHMARANPQWKAAAGDALCAFTGPHTYISPTWYDSENVVPTWNYLAVHVYGKLRIIEDTDQLVDIVRKTVDTNEQSMPVPWKMESQSNEFITALAKQIIGFEIEITSMEGKWKLNQNQPAERRQKVIDALRELDNDSSQVMADLMDAALNADSSSESSGSSSSVSVSSSDGLW